MSFSMKRIRNKVHEEEMNYVDEAFRNLPHEEVEFIKKYVAEI